MVFHLPVFPVLIRKHMKKQVIFTPNHISEPTQDSFREMDLYEFHRDKGCISDIEGRIIS